MPNQLDVFLFMGPWLAMIWTVRQLDKQKTVRVEGGL